MKSYAQHMEELERANEARIRIAELESALRDLVDACRNGLSGRERACHPARTLAYKSARNVLAKVSK